MYFIILHFVVQTFVLFVFVFCKNTTEESRSVHEVNVKTLKFVHAIWRHGDRNPLAVFPTDRDNPESTWPQGFGELTTKGMRQHYELGKFIKQRYKNFLSNAYNSKEIYVRSTDYNRTIMSALSNLAGMYPPNSNDTLNENIGWQPIPVHTRPKETDYLLLVSDSDYPCPKAVKIADEFLKSSPDVQKILHDNDYLFNFLKNGSGYKDITLKNLYNIFDPLTCIVNHNKTHVWPRWVNESIFDKVQNLTNVYLQLSFSTHEIQRFRGGALFFDISARMKEKSTKLDGPSKYYAYSAHDDTIIALMSNIGAHDGYNPPYASTILFEMHERDGQFYVEIFRRNGTSENDLRKVVVPNCNPCTVDKFLLLAQIKKPADILKECAQ